jgi:hypothetical protein
MIHNKTALDPRAATRSVLHIERRCVAEGGCSHGRPSPYSNGLNTKRLAALDTTSASNPPGEPQIF